MGSSTSGTEGQDRTPEDEVLLAQCLDALAAGGPDAAESLLAAQPSQAGVVRKHLAQLRRLGFIGDPDPTGEDPLPLRLGEFKPLRRIGRGGMGVVFLAEQESLGRRVVGAFFLSKYELTQAQWARVAATNPSSIHRPLDGAPRAGLHPVESVSWQDCSQALVRTDLGLPGDDEWEYACRAGTSTVYSCGDGPECLAGHANVHNSRGRAVAAAPEWGPPEPPHEDPFGAHGPVGSLLPNPWGLHDIHGNVWEWCRDEAPEDPGDGAASGVVSAATVIQRSCRGGAYNSPARLSRSATRSAAPEHLRRADIGVRPYWRIRP